MNNNNLKAVILDETSFNPGDLDMSGLLALNDNWQRYNSTLPEQRLERLKGVHIAVANKIKFDQELLSQLPDLKVILLTATGMDNLDLDACKQRGIATYNVSDYCTESVAQHVFSMILALTTQLLPYQKMTRSGEWSNSEHFTSLQFPIRELSGKTMGLVGYGNLAKGVEKIAKAFGMDIKIAARSGSTEAPEGRILLDDLLPNVDVLSLHCPLTPETLHLMGEKQFKRMKQSALLINTSRGAVVDSAALANALRNNEIAGAGIDVLEVEPPPADHPLLAQDIPNLILTPHIAWASIEARQRVVDKVRDNLANWLESHKGQT